jgi:glycosyltransferase involved in cell wall biosynthesis
VSALAGRRVVHVTTTDMSLALLLGPQLRAFAQAGMDVVGVSAPGPWVEQLTAQGIRHEPLRHATRSMAPGQDVLALGELVRLLRRLRPDIVHTHNPKPGLYGRLAARVAGVPVVVNTVHGLYATEDDRALRRAVVYGLERMASAFSQAELVQNEEDVAVLRRLGVPPAKLVMLGNGVDLVRFAPPADTEVAAARRALGFDPSDVVVGFVGRLVWQKGLRELFAAAAILRQRRPEVRMVVVGPLDQDKADGLSPADVDAARALGVEFLGRRDDVEVLYRGFDLFVLPSHREGFPRAAMEAAASAVPVIATDGRGGRQVVDHGVSGLLVPLRDAGALAAAVEELAADPARRRAMGEAARRKAEADFDDRRVVDRTLAVYERLVTDRGQGGQRQQRSMARRWARRPRA